jgi:hypothetical protein
MGLAFLISSASGKNEASLYKFTKEMPGIKGFPGIRKNSSGAVICSAFCGKIGRSGATDW